MDDNDWPIGLRFWFIMALAAAGWLLVGALAYAVVSLVHPAKAAVCQTFCHGDRCTTICSGD
jgi:hypothetical protein